MTVAEMVKTDSPEYLLSKVNYQLGVMKGRMNNMHTCDSPLRYPWPPDPKCPACRSRIERFVENEHLEIPYRLLGWHVIVHHYWEMIDRKAKQAEARREIGAGI